MKILISFIALVFFVGFSPKPKDLPPPPPTKQDPPPVVVEPIKPISLAWDTKIDRKKWTEKWISLIESDLKIYESAADISRICPKFFSLSKQDKIKAIGEFWVAVANFESSWNPKTKAVDVGTKDNPDSWSVGLYQLSVRDGANRRGPNYSFDELLQPIPNIDLAHLTMKRQIGNCGKIILQNSSKCRYWAVILDGNKYSKVDQIISRTKKNQPKCI